MRVTKTASGLMGIIRRDNFGNYKKMYFTVMNNKIYKIVRR